MESQHLELSKLRETNKELNRKLDEKGIDLKSPNRKKEELMDELAKKEQLIEVGTGRLVMVLFFN
jgi:hypothetical protein